MRLPDQHIAWIKSHPELVDVKKTSDPDLFVLKYKRKVFYDGLWNSFLEDCRGTIVDSDWNIITLPFRKVYNYGIEKEAPVLSDDTQVRIYKKYNGFMVAASIWKGELLLSTTGSIDSDFVEMAWESMTCSYAFREELEDFIVNHDATVLFECCHPNDPHIVDELPGLRELGFRLNDINADMSHMYKFFYSDEPDNEDQYTTIGHMKELARTCRHEGYVFYTEDGISGKIKSPYYLTKKLFMRGRDMKTLLARNAKEKIDEEYYPLLDYLSANRDQFDVMEEQERRKFIEEFLENINA